MRSVPQIRGVSAAILLWSLMVACSVQAATFHVSSSGSNTPPYDTFAKAANNPREAVSLSSGISDTVLIHTGQYDIDTTIDLPEGVTLVGIDRDSVDLVWHKLSSLNWMLHVAGHNEIYGITFVNPLGAGPDPHSVSIFMTALLSDGGLQIHNCRFDQFGISVTVDSVAEIYENEFIVWSGRGIASSLSHGLLWIHHNYFFGGVNTFGRGIIISDGEVLIENNEFDYSQTGTRGDPITISRFPSYVIIRNNLINGGQAYISWRYTTGVIENNTIIGPENPFRTFEIFLGSSDTLTMRNNILIDLNAGPELSNACDDCASTSSFIITHNAFWPPVGSFYRKHRAGFLYDNTVIDSANVNAFPMFEDNTNYRLQAGSPLIDAGHPAILDADGSRSDLGWTGGPEGITGENVELPPLAPDSLWLVDTDTVLFLEWTARPEADLEGYRIYRGSFSGFWMPGLIPSAVVPSHTTRHVIDTADDNETSSFYVVTAVDTVEMESPASMEIEFVEDTIANVCIPLVPRILRCFPNPTNAAIVIEFVLPNVGSTPWNVKIPIYNILGQEVGIIFSGTLSCGVHTVRWDGKSRSGEPLASGAYFTRVVIDGDIASLPTRIVLIR